MRDLLTGRLRLVVPGAPAPPRYRRLSPVNQPRAIEGNADPAIDTSEKFDDSEGWTSAAAPEIHTLTKGVRSRLLLPSSARAHIFWIAAGAHRQTSASDYWFVQGALEFYRGGTAAGRFEFSDASPLAAANVATAIANNASPVRTITRMRGDASGSDKPVLRYEQGLGGAARDNIDIPAFRLELQADRVDYVIESSFVYFASGPGATISFLTGLRVVSLF